MPLLRAALSWNFVLVTAVCASLLAQLIKVLLNLFIFHRFIATMESAAVIFFSLVRP